MYIYIYIYVCIYTYIYVYALRMCVATAGGASSTALRRCRKFQNRKCIGDVSCCDSWMSWRTDGLKGG